MWQKLVELFRKQEEPTKGIVATQAEMEAHARFRNRFGPETIITRTRHWKHIDLRPEYFPTIKESKKPDNPNFKRIKREYAEMAFDVTRGYYDYVVNLSGMSNRPDLHNVLKHTLLEFITMFWDMPASKNNHHSCRFGLLIHSLRVACENAEIGESFKLFTESGINTEAMLRDKGHIILAHFFVGLFHDAHKIHDYTLSHQTPYRKVEYNPHLGSILNFKLIHPTNLHEGWEALPQNTSHYSIAYMMWLVPPSFFNTVETSELYRHIMDRMRALIDGDIAGDKEDAILGLKEDAEQKMYLGLTAALKELLEETHDKDHVYQVSDEWCCVLFKSFMTNVSRRSPVFPNDAAVIHYMDHLGVLAAPSCDGTPKFSERYNVLVSSGPAKGKRVKKAGLAFIQKEFIDGIMLQVAREHDMHPELACVQLERNVFSEKSLVKGLIPPLPESAFCLPSDENGNETVQNPTSQPGPEAAPISQAVTTKSNKTSVSTKQTPHPAKGTPPETAPEVLPTGRQEDEGEEFHLSSSISEEEIMSGPPPEEPPRQDEDDSEEDPVMPEMETPSLAQNNGQDTELLPHERIRREKTVEEMNAEIEAALSYAAAPEDDGPIEDAAPSEEIKGTDQIVTDAGEILDHESFLSQLFVLLNKKGINNPKKPLAIYVTNGDATKGKLFLKVPEVFEHILGMNKMLQSEDGQRALIKTIHMLSRSEIVAPIKEGLPEIMNEVSYFAIDDFEDSHPIKIKRFMGVELIEMFTAKRQIRPLREYVELRNVEEVRE
ncbi:TraI domain-containing protein [Pseudodesulfovibrio pelocollis]|uniref:TraI domain-containing protein n=1 Tax=Pseudodesulfovibrio pelocollis TaxID=3051432 RepID=UPI00255A93DE|nr:TraI domain-containing protein [Pseudodesulfovibrio sp. SB368]